MDKERLGMPLNCRENLVLSTASVHLQLDRLRKVADDDGGDHNVPGVAVVKFEACEFTCEGLISSEWSALYMYCLLYGFIHDTDNDTEEKSDIFFFYLFIFSFVCGNTWKKQTKTTNKIYLSKQLKYISKTPYPQNREGNQGGRQTNIKINSLITILTEQRNDQKSNTHNTLMSLVYLTRVIMIIYIVFTYKYVVCVI